MSQFCSFLLFVLLFAGVMLNQFHLNIYDKTGRNDLTLNTNRNGIFFLILFVKSTGENTS